MFSAAVILFVMRNASPPFANVGDAWYKTFCKDNKLFWTSHSESMTGGMSYYNDDFVDLINHML